MITGFLHRIDEQNHLIMVVARQAASLSGAMRAESQS